MDKTKPNVDVPPPIVIQAPDQHPQAEISPTDITQPEVKTHEPETITSAASADKEAHTKGFFDSFKNNNEGVAGGGGSLFDKINLFGKSEDHSKESSSGEDNSSSSSLKKHSNLLFYVIVISAAIIFVSIFIMTQQERKKKKPQTISSERDNKSSFLMVYNKEIYSPSNIFYFSMRIENGSAYFSVDDLKSEIHFSKPIAEIPPAELQQLEDQVKKTSFMALDQNSVDNANEGSSSVRTLIVGYGKELNQITVKGSYAPTSFEEVEEAIDEFSEFCGLKTISLTPEEKRAEGLKAFRKAEDLLANYEARNENLHEAISRYQIALDLLKLFSPKPKEWDIARKQQQKAKELKKEKLDKIKYNIMRLKELGKYQEARDECANGMETATPGSKLYGQLRDWKIKFDRVIRKNKKK
jgi:tetratricopeptide (TPR) repeat protein